MRIKRVLMISAVIAVLAGGMFLFISSSFEKRTDVCLLDYSVSGDGSVITLRTILSGSMGYIRDIETEQRGDAVYCSFYRAFGGLNSSIGARNRFEIRADDAVSEIYFDRGGEGDVLVLRKDEAADAWVSGTAA